jgi:hypothetical protein
MNATYKNRWMVWAIVVLAVMNISTILTIVYHHNQSVQTESNTVPEQFQTEGAPVKYSGRDFRDQLNLNRDQMNRFVEFNPEFRQQARSININLERIRHQMLTEMAAKNSDSNKLDLLSDSIGYLHSDLKKITYMYYLNIKNICDQQQQKKLEQLFGEMFTSNVQTGQYGKGPQNGRRYGRRFNN